VAFHDDGVPPDALAGDGVFSATVPPTLEVAKGFSGELLVEVDVEVAEETGTLQFRFAQTAAVPARFTKTARDAVEGGSLAIYLGIEVLEAGRYDLRGRLYDAKGAPVAFMTYVGELGPSAREVRLFAYGKLLRDQGAVPPFVLKDIEGWRYLEGQYPDREQMEMWTEGTTTAAYDASALTDQPWEAPEKQAKLRSFDDAVKRGPSEIAPVDSNGIPLPPKPLVLPPPPK
jgi:hypothetical protein